jgi:hypothetical protein
MIFLQIYKLKKKSYNYFKDYPSILLKFIIITIGRNGIH